MYHFAALKKRVGVYVAAIQDQGGTYIDHERSALLFTDLNLFYPQDIPLGPYRGKYVDLCSYDDRERQLRIESQKGQIGYRLKAIGTYTFTVEVEAGDRVVHTAKFLVQVTPQGSLEYV